MWSIWAPSTTRRRPASPTSRRRIITSPPRSTRSPPASRSQSPRPAPTAARSNTGRGKHRRGTAAVASSGVAAANAGVGAAVFVEQLGESFEHDAAELLGVDDRDGAAVVAGHVVADADRCKLHFAEALDVVDHLAQMLFEGVAGGDG